MMLVARTASLFWRNMLSYFLALLGSGCSETAHVVCWRALSGKVVPRAE